MPQTETLGRPALVFSFLRVCATWMDVSLMHVTDLFYFKLYFFFYFELLLISIACARRRVFAFLWWVLCVRRITLWSRLARVYRVSARDVSRLHARTHACSHDLHTVHFLRAVCKPSSFKPIAASPLGCTYGRNILAGRRLVVFPLRSVYQRPCSSANLR